MLLPSLLTILIPATALSAPPPPQAYSTWLATSFLSKTPPIDRYYVSAVLHQGLHAAGTLHNNTSLLTHVSSALSSLVSPNGTLTGWKPTYYSLDDLRIGNNLLTAYQEGSSPDVEKYKTAANSLRRQLETYPRTPTGGFWHRDPQYKNQMWLDGIYMADVFYARWTAFFDATNTTAWDDIARQFDLVETHCRNVTTGLLVHGYDESKQATWADKKTGAAPNVWIRAVGWYTMALVDVLDVFPKDLPGYARLVAYFRELAEALVKAQDGESGGWWLVMNEPYPGKKGNYIESSGTAMFVYGLLKGVRVGLLEDEERYRGAAERAYGLMVERFLKKETNGTVSWEGTVKVGSLDRDGSYEYYTSVPLSENDGKGAGPFMFASVEMEMWKGSKR